MTAVAVPDGLFTGVGVALVTLFHEDGSLDAPASATLATELVALGVQAVLVAGSTGEAAALSPPERLALLDAVRAAVTTVPVIAGTGAPSARQAIELTAGAVDHGADAVLAVSPAGAADPRAYYDQLAKVVGAMPLLAYHVPFVSAPGIPVEMLPDIPASGCKDSSGDAGRLLQTLTTYDRPLYVGSAALLSFAGPLGATGAILSLANIDPEGCIAAFAGDPAAQLALAPAHAASMAGFPLGAKQMVAARFGTSTVTRLG